MPHHCFKLVLCATALATFALPVDAQPEAPRYMGREIATTMSHHGADWLTRKNRQAQENTSALHAALAVKPGASVCDVGAGNGYHSLMLARAVGSRGQVFASDIQPEMLDLLDQRARKAHVKNIKRILGTPPDPRLPDGACDLVLLVDVYHEFSDPAAMLQAIRRALSPTGRVALVEFRAEDPKVPIKELHKMSVDQILREYQANGFQLHARHDKLPWQHLLFFVPAERPADKAP